MVSCLPASAIDSDFKPMSKNTSKPQADAPPSSMTGYAHVQKQTRCGLLTLELRSVNSRFLDLQFRMNDDLRVAEPLLRERINAALSRGKVECRLSWGRNDGVKTIPKVDLDLVRQLATLEQAIQSAMPKAAGFRTTDILNWPGVVEDNSLSSEELNAALSELIDEALQSLMASRQREGAQLAQVLAEKIEGMVQIVQALEPQIPVFLEQYEQKIRERMLESFDKMIQEKASHLTVADIEERVRHEVTLHSVRIDIREELDRLNTHFKEIQRIFKKGGVVGKRLDFITQELNREANTLGSKAHAYAQTQASIDLKVLIEQFREQVQNLE